MFIALGLFTVLYSLWHYRVGTARDMGPGFMPLLVGGLLAVIGVVVLLRSFFVDGGRLTNVHWRPLLLIPVAAAGYGLVLLPFGIIISTILLVIVAAFAGPEFRWKEAVVLGVVLAFFSWAVFVYGLALPIPMWPRLLMAG
jgi:hypothetical protein